MVAVSRARGMDYGMGLAKVSQRLTAKPPMVAVRRTRCPHQSPSGWLDELVLRWNEIDVSVAVKSSNSVRVAIGSPSL